MAFIHCILTSFNRFVLHSLLNHEPKTYQNPTSGMQTQTFCSTVGKWCILFSDRDTKTGIPSSFQKSSQVFKDSKTMPC